MHLLVIIALFCEEQYVVPIKGSTLVEAKNQVIMLESSWSCWGHLINKKLKKKIAALRLHSGLAG